MKKTMMMCMAVVLSLFTGSLQAQTLYDFTATAQGGEPVSLDKYRGKVVLIVNTASRCGFTPQYADLERLYETYSGKGFEILDFPCNQFGGQSPESDEETTQFCQLNYGTQFPQYSKIEVNGEHETPLYAWLKSQKGFSGFDKSQRLGELLDGMLKKENPDYAANPDIKWNFTKFLIDREGKVVERFEPTTDMKVVEEAVASCLGTPPHALTE